MSFESQYPIGAKTGNRSILYSEFALGVAALGLVLGQLGLVLKGDKLVFSIHKPKKDFEHRAWIDRSLGLKKAQVAD
jgi:hypothetical protein